MFSLILNSSLTVIPFQYLKDIVILSFHLYCFQQKFPVILIFVSLFKTCLTSFKLLSLPLVLNNLLCVFMSFSSCVLCLGFATLFGAVVYGFHQNIGHSFFKYFSVHSPSLLQEVQLLLKLSYSSLMLHHIYFSIHFSLFILGSINCCLQVYLSFILQCLISC